MEIRSGLLQGGDDKHVVQAPVEAIFESGVKRIAMSALQEPFIGIRPVRATASAGSGAR
jgi:hypothetical protein